MLFVEKRLSLDQGYLEHKSILNLSCIRDISGLDVVLLNVLNARLDFHIKLKCEAGRKRLRNEKLFIAYLFNLAFSCIS